MEIELEFSPRKLRAARVLAEMRQEDLATKLRWTREPISAFERGRRVPSKRKIGYLAEALGVQPGDLYEAKKAEDE